ncbi:MAG: YihY/virulence factor BrkB family protein [Pseudomonadota bacterium]|nr:YihY/virulence factor BrkB family protein [Pseudomonadota bacterium]
MAERLHTFSPQALRDPKGVPRRWGGLLWRALSRNWGRDVMLYTGGVSFFALLAVFPALGIMIGLYGVFTSPAEAGAQAAAFADLLPEGAEELLRGELNRLVSAPAEAVSLQSLVALVITAYAAHRGFKALLAGLNFIHEEGDPHGFVGFNLLAGFVAVAAFAVLIVTSTAFLTIRVIAQTFPFDLPWILSEWLWASLGLTGGLTLLYRYAMSRAPTPWRPSVVGGVGAALLSLAASWACAVYVETIAPLGATYGSIGAVVVFLIWLSWNVNAVFFGAALATEIEHAALEGPELL